MKLNSINICTFARHSNGLEATLPWLITITYICIYDGYYDMSTRTLHLDAGALWFYQGIF